ncbi:MAG: AEC family transporter [Acidaminococcaceae bacterium]
MEYFYRVLTQLEIFSVMILLGVFAVKTNAMNEKSLGDLSKLIMRLILPVMIFHKSINGATKDDMMSSFAEVVLASFFMFVVLFTVGYSLKKAFALKGNYGRVYQAATMFGNVGFIGIPLILGILPERGMLYMALFFIVDQIVLWSLGFYMTLPEEKLAHASLKSNLKNIMSPAMIAIMIALFFIMTEWKLPATLNKALSAVGAATTPLSLMYIGGSFCYSNVSQFITRLEYYAIVIGKMIVAPVVVFIALRAVNIQEEVVTVITTLTGVPSMAAIAMFARTNGSDEDCAIGAILITTILSLFTLPLVAYITSNLLS